MLATWKIGAFFVLVDRDDGLGILYAGELHRTRDADRDVDFRSDDLAGLAIYLVVVRHVARVDRGAGADARVQLVGQREDDLLEGFRVLQGASCPRR